MPDPIEGNNPRGVTNQPMSAAPPVGEPARIELESTLEEVQSLVTSFKAAHSKPLPADTSELDKLSPERKDALFESHIAYMREFLKWTHRALEGDKPLEPCSSYPLEVWRPTKEEREDPKRKTLDKLTEPLLREMLEQWSDLEIISRSISTDAAQTSEKERLRSLGAIFAEELHDYYNMSPFGHRLVDQARVPGNFGNYGVVIMMRSDPWAAPSMFGKMITKFFQNEPSVLAHLNRIGILSHDIANEVRFFKERGDQGTFDILSEGCGPALEIHDYILGQRPEDLISMKIVLIDSNPDALRYAKDGIKKAALERRALCVDLNATDACTVSLLESAWSEGIPIIEVETREEEIIRTAYHSYRKSLTGSNEHGSAREVQEKFNMIEEAGIDDYAADPAAALMTHRNSHRLRPKGVLVKTNVADTNPFEKARCVAFKWFIESRNEVRMLLQTYYLDAGAQQDFVGYVRDMIKNRKMPLSERGPVEPNPEGKIPGTTQYAVTLDKDPTGVNRLMRVRSLAEPLASAS